MIPRGCGDGEGLGREGISVGGRGGGLWMCGDRSRVSAHQVLWGVMGREMNV